MIKSIQAICKTLFSILKSSLLLLSLLVFISSGRAFATGGTDHFVFLIHGVGGNFESFGKMEEALTAHLNADSRLGRVQVLSFAYPTSDDTLTTADFAKQFNKFIIKSFEKYGHAETTMSIVAHSQGGIVTTVWYYESYLGKKDGFSPELAGKLKTVVTLGTPFWGSKVATFVVEYIAGFAETFPNVFAKIKDILGTRIGPLGAMGHQQVLDMSLGSATTQTFRRNTMKFDSRELESIFSNVHVLNVSGNANLKQLTAKPGVIDKIQNKYEWFKPEIFNRLLPFVFGVTEYEADGLVLVPSSTLNTIYLTDLSSDYADGDWIKSDRFSELRIADRLIVKSVHASSKPELINDIVYIPEDCVKNVYCDHPTYSYILEYLLTGRLNHENNAGAEATSAVSGAGQLYSSPNVKLYNFGGFTIDVNVRLPKGYEHMRGQVRVLIQPERRELLSASERAKTPLVKVNLKTELYSFIRQETELFPDSVLNWFTGHIVYTDLKTENYDEKFRTEGSIVKISIVAPWMKQRNIEVPVRPLLSTYIDVMMAVKDTNLKK